MIVKPTIHMNGTSLDRLIEDNQRATDALQEALATMVNTGPNGRDYYPQGPKDMQDAQDQHYARMLKVQEVIRELNEIGEHLGEEEIRRMVRR